MDLREYKKRWKGRIRNAETERDIETDLISEGLSPLRRHGGHGLEGKPFSHLITHKYRGSQQFSRVKYSTQIYWLDTRGAKEYSQVLAVELSIQPHLDNLISTTKYLVAK